MSLYASKGSFDVTQAQIVWCGVMLILGLTCSDMAAPRRRRVVGDVRFMAQRAAILCLAAFGVNAVRGGLARGQAAAGQNRVLAQLDGVFWAGVLTNFGRLSLRLFPPTAWLLKEHRRAQREASDLRAMFAGASRPMSIGR